ncbi:MAG: NAD-dependent epimerase/dehydratase family protein [Candidatus Solibacter usitatus]|nr:NAD-dependent epimerase/dehydratase family protein [Candidatus Solibacter usitatus]
MRALVIGGTMFIGRQLVQSLVKAGHETFILHRKTEHDFGKKVGNLTADRNDAASLKRALAGEKFDYVFDNAYDWQRGTTASHVEATVRACGDNLKRYVFMSSVAAYGDGLNHHEGDALAPDDHPDTYVRNKATSERLLFRMHQRHGIPVVTLRPPYIYGPGNPFYREAFFWDRMRDGRPLIIPGDGRRLMQFAFVKDVVWACMKALDEPAAVGHAFNIANSRPLTQVEVVQALAQAAGRKPPLVRIPRERILQAGGHPLNSPLYFGVYFDMPAITQVVSKAQRVLRFRATTFDEGLKETYRWYQRNRTRQQLDYTFEDRLLARYQVAATVAS